MSDAPARLCAACLAPMAEAARFCSRCGVPVDAPLHPPRWPELKVALQLWVVLVLCSGGVGIAMHVTGSESPFHEMIGSIAFAVLVIAFALPMRRELAAALSPAPVTLRSILIALFAAGFLLGFIHLLPAMFISHFVIGLTLGWLRQRTGSLLPGMITHFVYNSVLVFIELL